MPNVSHYTQYLGYEPSSSDLKAANYVSNLKLIGNYGPHQADQLEQSQIYTSLQKSGLDSDQAAYYTGKIVQGMALDGRGAMVLVQKEITQATGLQTKIDTKTQGAILGESILKSIAGAAATFLIGKGIDASGYDIPKPVVNTNNQGSYGGVSADYQNGPVATNISWIPPGQEMPSNNMLLIVAAAIVAFILIKK
jgi:hypothetical protein